MRRSVRVVSTLCVLFLLASASHASIIKPPDTKINNVYLKLSLLALSSIDGVDQTFTMDFFLVTFWAAPLPANSTLVCTPYVTSLRDCSYISAGVISDTFWLPSLQFINSRDDITESRSEPYKLVPNPPFLVEDADKILPPGWVWIIQDQRYQIKFATPLVMKAFPYDIQHLAMNIETQWRSDQVALKYFNPTTTTIDQISSEMTPAVGWDYQYSDISATNHTYIYNNGAFSRMVYTSTWKRQPQYYLTKIVAGTMLLVWMAIWNFSLQVDVSDRMMGTLQVFTGLIAFLFVAGGDTPKLPYQTRLDVFMMFSFVIVGFIMFIHGALYYFREQGFEGEKADKLTELERKKRRKFIIEAQKRNLFRTGKLLARGGGNNGSQQMHGNISGLNSINNGTMSVVMTPNDIAAINAAEGSTPMNGNHAVASPQVPSQNVPAGTKVENIHIATPSGVELVSPKVTTAQRNDDVTPIPNVVPSTSTPQAEERKLIHLQPTFATLPTGLGPERLRSGSQSGGTAGAAYMDSQDEPHDVDEKHLEGWEVRLNDWSQWNVVTWFASLACTRKWDVIIVPTLFAFYTIGSAVILGRKPSDGTN